MKISSRLACSLVFSFLLHAMFFGGGNFGQSTWRWGDAKNSQFMPDQPVRLQISLRQPLPPLTPQAPASKSLAETRSTGQMPVNTTFGMPPAATGEAVLPLAQTRRRPILKGSIEISLDNESLDLFAFGEALFDIEINDIGRVVAVSTVKNAFPESVRLSAEQALRQALFIPAYEGGYTQPSRMRWELKIKPVAAADLGDNRIVIQEAVGSVAK